jgi:hypothetical protein
LTLAREARADPKVIQILQHAADGTLDFSLYDLTDLNALFEKTTILDEHVAVYKDLFQTEHFLDAKSLATLDRNTLKVLGVKLADTNQILNALGVLSEDGDPTPQGIKEEEEKENLAVVRFFSLLCGIRGRFGRVR